MTTMLRQIQQQLDTLAADVPVFLSKYAGIRERVSVSPGIVLVTPTPYEYQ
jgi:hypothetical protein